MNPFRAMRWVASAVLLMALGSGVALAQIPEEQRAALIELYNATGGPNWTHNDYWLGPPGTESTWHGIYVDLSLNSVRHIVLSGNNLTGTIPEIWSAFPDLLYMDLSGNQLVGPLPASLGSVWQLRSVDLHDNELTGTIPAEWQNLRFLYELDVGQNCLDGPLPYFLGVVTRNAWLSVDNNGFWGPVPRSLLRGHGSLPVSIYGNALRTSDPALRYWLGGGTYWEKVQVPVPGKPSANAYGQGEALLQWEQGHASNWAFEFRIYQSADPEGPYTMIQELPFGVFSCRVPGLPTNLPTFFKIRSYGPPTYLNKCPVESEPGPALKVVPSGALHLDVQANDSLGPLTSPFAFSASIWGGVGAVSCQWDFGDGATGTGPSLSHQYAGPGEYTVTVTATDSMGASATAGMLVTAYPPPSVLAASEPDQQVGKFNFYVQVQDGAPPYTYLWEFGDGGTSTQELWVNHTYGAPGEYLWTVTVTDALGNTANASGTADYELPPQLAASALPNWGGVPLAVEFRAQAIGGVEPLLVEWDFGDDTPSAQGEQVSHTYTQAWMYTWRVRVRDARGRESVATGKIYAGLPRITSASAGGSPFTLKVRGDGFSQGCTVFINGQQAPKTAYKNSSHLIAKGSGLASMLPREETAVLQVLDPSVGLLCEPFRYYRENAPLPGKSPSRPAVSLQGRD